MVKQTPSSDSALSIIPSVLNAISAVGEAMPPTFKIPAPASVITGAVQVGILRKEQIQRTVMHALPTGIKEGLATKSAQGFALGTLSGALMYDVKHHRQNMDELRAAFRNASEKGEITLSNPLSFYVPKSPQEAVSTLLTHLVQQDTDVHLVTNQKDRDFYNAQKRLEETQKERN